MLGPFEVIQRIGQGGMGTVWKGRHGNTGQLVALKVLRSELADDQVYAEGFHREVQSIARLDHPGIVQVFDYGVVSRQAAKAHPELQAGTLWLAMEYASDGSLFERPMAQSWSELQHILLQLLDALGHAHARGLVHRDLKPANILRRPESPNQQSTNDPDQADTLDWMLSDFGLAYMRDPHINEHTGDVSSASAGTPSFMAPEQFQGNWRKFGPWTDLYSLGILGFSLASGERPFDGPSPVTIGIKHITTPVPKLRPRIAVPPGYENWLRRLLSKDIRHRYQWAADAATDLLRLGEPTAIDEIPGGMSRDEVVSEDAETLVKRSSGSPRVSETLKWQTQLLNETRLRSTLAADRDHGDDRPGDAPPPQPTRVIQPPSTWNEAPPGRRLRTIPGTGKGIFGVRQPPFVGRREARDHIWEQFRQVCTEGQARFVLIRGDAGLGKSRLMQWLSARTHELGVATSLTASHSPIMNPTDGLPHSFKTHLSATGLDRAALAERLLTAYADFFDDEEPDREHLASLVEWMEPRSDDDDESDKAVAVVQLESLLERYLTIEGLLRDMTQRRPVVLCIDDGQWAQDSLGFTRHLLANRDERPLPVLVVATLRSGALKERLTEREFLSLLLDHQASSTIDLAPLNKSEQRQLIESLLGLEQPLIEQINAVSDGNPFFAIQLIEDWVGRDALRDTGQGYALAPEESIPSDLESILERRIDDIAAEWHSPMAARLAMESAAALGTDVDRDEWEAVCRAQNIAVDDGLFHHFMHQGLAVPKPQGWRFRLRVYRDILKTISLREDRWPSLHGVIAGVIDSTGHNGTCLAERRARHLLVANKRQEAIPLLWRAAEKRMEQSAYIQAQSLLTLIETVFDELHYPQDHCERFRLRILRSESHRFLGDTELAREILDEICEQVDDLPDALRAQVHRSAGSFESHLGEMNRALNHYQRAYELFEKVGDERGVAKCLDGLGWTYMRINQSDDARRVYAEGVELAEAAGLRLEAAWCLCGLAEPSLTGGAEGKQYIRRAQQLFTEVGCRSGQAITHWNHGNYARLDDDLEQARDHYERARHLATMVGHYVVSQSSQAMLGICDLVDGDIDEAERRFTGFQDVIEATNAAHFATPLADLGLFAVAAYRRDHDAFDGLAERLERPMETPNILRRDFAMLLELVAKICLDQDDQARHQRAQHLLQLVTRAGQR